VVYAEQAMQTVLHCRRQYPGSAAVRRLEAEILVSQGRDQEALAEYAALLRDGSAAAGLHHDIAMLYRQRGEWDKALEEFKAENKAAPDDERALVGISECLLRLERFDALSQHLKPVLAANDAPEWALLDAATAAQQAAKLEQAIGYLKRLAAQNPANSSAHYRLSKLYAAMARPDQARREMFIFRKLRSYE
jgi:tetratricopeptide (TPR) repeat protein